MPLDATFNNRDEKTVTITMRGYENQFITVMPCYRVSSKKLKLNVVLNTKTHSNMMHGSCNEEEWMKCVWQCCLEAILHLHWTFILDSFHSHIAEVVKKY